MNFEHNQIITILPGEQIEIEGINKSQKKDKEEKELEKIK